MKKFKPVKVTKINDRGFHQYGTACEDTYGNTFRVVESSAATDPHVWLFIYPSVSMPEGDALHLSEKNVEELIRRLQTWVDEIPKKWGG
jgi:hypothetical protein